jgi:hypothetical protein
MRTLQQFPKPDKDQFYANDIWNGKTWEYTPIFNHVQDLPPGRRRLILAHRGLMKTTVNVQAHTIQWIINYPSLAMAIFQSTGSKAEAILDEIRNHFKINETFRRLFPEHCPQKNVSDWGTKERLTTLARPKSVVRREPTIMALSIDKGTAGYHFDVIKHSDIVEENNVKSIESITSIIDSFDLSKSLLVGPGYWIDVEGTLYNPKDLYNRLLKHWWTDKNAGIEPEYLVHIQGCYRLLDPKTKKQQTIFTPETLDDAWVEMRDAQGHPVPWWAADAAGKVRFPYELLERQRRTNPYVFSCQYMLKPRMDVDGKVTFNLNNITKVSMETFFKNIRPLVVGYSIGLDTAYTDNERSNNSAFVVIAWDRAGRGYVREIVRKKLLPEALIAEIFRMNEKYKPISFVIEETQFVTGLRVGIEEEFVRRKARMIELKVPWNLEYVKTDNQQKKILRIYNTLQEPFANDRIRFVVPPYNVTDPYFDKTIVDRESGRMSGDETREAFEESLRELKEFPLGEDDFLDALSDIFQKKEVFGRLGPRDRGDPSAAESRLEFLTALGIAPEKGYRFPKR